jgi:hypothetical protein
VWARLDTALWRQVKRIRGDGFVEPQRAVIFDELGYLPLKLGGLGIPSHKVITGFAATAATEAARLTLSRVFPSLPLPRAVNIQRDLCNKYYTSARNTIFTAMSIAERCAVLEAGSQVGSAWLAAMPTQTRTTLSDAEVVAALRIRYGRKLADSTRCQACSLPYSTGHPDVCQRNHMTATVRHNLIVRACARMAASAKGVTVTLEPPTEGSPSLRNDLRLESTDNARLQAVDVDVSVLSLPSRAPREHATLLSATAVRDPSATDFAAQAAEATQSLLLTRHGAKLHKVGNFPAYLRTHTFRPLVISAGGVLEESSLALIKTWLAAASPWAKAHFWKDLSLTIVRCRAPACR